MQQSEDTSAISYLICYMCNVESPRSYTYHKQNVRAGVHFSLLLCVKDFSMAFFHLRSSKPFLNCFKRSAIYTFVSHLTKLLMCEEITKFFLHHLRISPILFHLEEYDLIGHQTRCDFRSTWHWVLRWPSGMWCCLVDYYTIQYHIPEDHNLSM
jgi:hypothetical protein